MGKYSRVLGVVIFSITVWGQAITLGSLKGVITDPAGAVLPKARIRIDHWILSGSKHPVLRQAATIYTDASGKFSIQLPPGIYDVFISSAAFSPVAKKMKIEGGKITDLPIELQFDPLVRFVE